MIDNSELIIAYVDEAGEKGITRNLTPERDDGIGLFLSLSFPAEKHDEIKTAFDDGYKRFLKAMPNGSKTHITDAFSDPNSEWAKVANEVRTDFFKLIKEYEIPVVYEARRLRVARSTREFQKKNLDFMKSQRRSEIQISNNESKDFVESSLMTGLAFKLDALCEDSGRSRIDINFDETDLLEIYQKDVDRIKNLGQEKEIAAKGWDKEKKTPVKVSGTLILSAKGLDHSLAPEYLGKIDVTGKDSSLILATDITANALLHHLKSLSNESPLNAPSSILDWELKDRVYGVRDGAFEDLI